MQIISIDCGRDALKGFTSGNRLCIRSVVGEPRELKIGEYGDYDVTINGKRYFIAELAERESRFSRSMVSRSKIHEDTAVLSLTAIALLATESDIRVVTGLPVEQHDPATKREYIKLLSGNHIIMVNGERRNIILSENHIAVSIEGGGAYWAEQRRAANCYIIDAGSRTINAVAVMGNRFRDIESVTLNYGCLEIENAGGTDQAAEGLARRIYADLCRQWLNIHNTPILLTGGGALLMERWLRDIFPGARIVDDPVWANAIGYYRLGMMKWGCKA